VSKHGRGQGDKDRECLNMKVVNKNGRHPPSKEMNVVYVAIGTKEGYSTTRSERAHGNVVINAEVHPEASHGGMEGCGEMGRGDGTPDIGWGFVGIKWCSGGSTVMVQGLNVMNGC